ncbi:hypothetical protein LP420_39640 [Massilia sp. B-10]|nr:hypothetical protein LP420_39640 [Massilia sp. B-10]
MILSKGTKAVASIALAGRAPINVRFAGEKVAWQLRPLRDPANPRKEKQS